MASFSWSYSVMGMFENCPRKYWAVKIAKIDDSNKFNIKGDEEHQGIERYLKSGLLLPPRMQPLTRVLDLVKHAPGEMYIEYKMALKRDLTVTHGRDWDGCWVRINADLIKVNNDAATYLDWKSGKARDSEDQINLTALGIFRLFPAVQKVKGGLVHYTENKLSSPTIVHRSDESRLWNGFITRASDIERAVQTNDFPTNPNPLCGWCPYRACPFNRQDEREKVEATGAKWKWRPL
jgi:hypothetical protein